MHTAYPCLSTMPGHVFLWDLLCMCDLLCSARQQLGPTPSEQPLKVTWASHVPSDRQNISHSVSRVIFWVVRAPSQETVLDEKPEDAGRRVVLLHLSKQVCWNKQLEILVVGFSRTVLDEPRESAKEGWPLRDLEFSCSRFLSPFPSPFLKRCWQVAELGRIPSIGLLCVVGVVWITSVWIETGLPYLPKDGVCGRRSPLRDAVKTR